MNSRDKILLKQLNEDLEKIDIDEKELEEESKRRQRKNIGKLPPGLQGKELTLWMWEEGGFKDMETQRLQIEARRWEAQKKMYELMPWNPVPTGMLQQWLSDLYAQVPKLSTEDQKSLYTTGGKIHDIEDELLRRNDTEIARQINQVANSFSALQTQNLTVDARNDHKKRIYANLKSLASQNDQRSRICLSYSRTENL